MKDMKNCDSKKILHQNHQTRKEISPQVLPSDHHYPHKDNVYQEGHQIDHQEGVFKDQNHHQHYILKSSLHCNFK